MNPTVTSSRSSLTSHLSWIFNTTFIAHINLCATKCIVKFIMVKNSKQWRYLDARMNFYKLHATQILIGTINQNCVFFFSIIILCHQKMQVPSGWSNLYLVTKLLVAHEIINTRHLKQVKNQIVVHWFKGEAYFITWKRC